MNPDTATPKATRREWIGLAVIALPCLLYSMDLTVLYLAVPSLAADLKPGSSELLWIVDIYGFLVAGLLITMGTLGDRIGRRRLLMFGAAAFGAASVLAAFSTSAEMLIAARALLGIAGATLAPSTLSLIRNMFLDADERRFAIGIWATSYSVGAAIGPLFGGVLLAHFWWGSVFLAGVPVMVLLLIVGPMLLPEFRDPKAGRLDIASALLSLIAVLGVIYGVKHGAEHGFGRESAAWVVAGLVVGFLFAHRQSRLADPLIDLRLFRVRAFSIALAANTLSLFVAFGTFLYIAQYLQLGLGLSPLMAGLWTVPSSLGFVAGSMVAPMLVRWMRPAYAMAGGLLLAAAGFALLTQIDAGGGLALLVFGSIVLALGTAPVVTLATDLVVGTAPPERAGAASAISETGAELGGALGIAILGSIGTAVYGRLMATTLPNGITGEAAATAAATLGGAVDIATRLPADLAAPLLAAARSAFAQALTVAGAIGAAILIAVAIATLIILRSVGPTPRPEKEAGEQETVLQKGTS